MMARVLAACALGLALAACGVSLKRGEDAPGDGGGGQATTSAATSQASAGGEGGHQLPGVRDECERFVDRVVVVSTELGCRTEIDARTCDPVLYDACPDEKALQFGCLADGTVTEKCSCELGAGGSGGGGGAEFICDWRQCDTLGAAVDAACPASNGASD